MADNAPGPRDGRTRGPRDRRRRDRVLDGRCSGTGTAAAAGAQSALTANQTTTLSAMYPGDTAQTISGNFDNPNPGPIHVSTVTVSISSVTKAAGAPAAGGASVAPGGTCGAPVTGSAASLSCQDSGVPAGSWTYTVTPVLRSWTGSESAAGAAVTVTPSAPVLQSASAANPGSAQTTGDVTLAWMAATGAAGYNVYRRTSSGSYNFAAPLNGATPVAGTTYQDPGSGLGGAATYDYVVRGVANGIESVSSNELAASPVNRPAAPTGIAAAAAAAGRINVTWNAVAGAAGYNVYRCTTARPSPRSPRPAPPTPTSRRAAAV